MSPCVRRFACARAAVGVSLVFGVAREDLGAGLISLRAGDEGEDGLEVVARLDEAVREHVEEVLVPRLGLHRVDGVNDAAAHEAVPETVDDGALEAAVLRMGDERGELGETLLPRLGGIDLAELRERPGGDGRLAGRYIAADELHRPVRVDGGEAVGVAELPAVGEAVVARGALHVDAEERLRDALRELELGHLARAHRAAPDDALGEAFAVGGRRHELAREPVVRLVGEQREVEPVGDLLAAAVDVAGTGVIVAQEVVPEDHPVVGVVDVAGEELPHERLALVGPRVAREGAGLFGGRQQADEVQHDATLEGGVIRRRRRRGALGREPSVEHAVERMRTAGLRFGKRRTARTQRRLIGRLLEGEPFGPDRALLHPCAQDGDFRLTHARAFRRHALVGIFADDRLEQASLRVLSRTGIMNSIRGDTSMSVFILDRHGNNL